MQAMRPLSIEAYTTCLVNFLLNLQTQVWRSVGGPHSAPQILGKLPFYTSVSPLLFRGSTQCA